jgi:hypothetical protein
LIFSEIETIQKSEKMTDFAHLVTSKVNIGLVQELACNELLEILDKCEGTKVKSSKSSPFLFLSISFPGSDVG